MKQKAYLKYLDEQHNLIEGVLHKLGCDKDQKNDLKDKMTLLISALRRVAQTKKGCDAGGIIDNLRKVYFPLFAINLNGEESVRWRQEKRRAEWLLRLSEHMISEDDMRVLKETIAFVESLRDGNLDLAKGFATAVLRCHPTTLVKVDPSAGY